MRRDIEWRYHGIKTDLRQLFDSSLPGNEISGHSHQYVMAFNNVVGLPSMYWTNAGEYSYELDGAALARLLARIQFILDAWLVEGGPEHIWTSEFIGAEYARGTQAAFTSLSKQSEEYARQTVLSELLYSPEYQRRIGIAYAQSYSDWKGISDKARIDLANVLSDAVARGINPRATMKIISHRLDVSMSAAFNMAQTEQVGAYRHAIWDETEDTQRRLGMRTALLWLSALKATTRTWHAGRHGKTFTIEEVKAFYAKDGNRYHCYCSQQPVLVDAQGKPLNSALVERLTKERKEWLGETHESDGPKVETKPETRPKKKTSSYTAPAYERLNTVSKVNRWAAENVAETAKIPAGVNIEQLNNCMQLTAELQDRFGLQKLRYLGGINGDTYSYKRNEGMIGGYVHGTNAMLVTKTAFNADDLTAIDIRARAHAFKAKSLAAVESTGNKALIAAIKGSDSISWHAVPTPRGVFSHEFGHAVHRTFTEKFDKLGREAFAGGWQYAMSAYGQTKYSEYLAEAFSLYIENPREAERRIYPPLLAAFEEIDKAK